MGHKSWCAVHNEPAFPAGECICGAMTDDIPAAKVEAVVEAIAPVIIAGMPIYDLDAKAVAILALRAAAAWDAEHGPDTSQDLTVAFQAGLRAGYDAALKEGRE